MSMAVCICMIYTTVNMGIIKKFTYLFTISESLVYSVLYSPLTNNLASYTGPGILYHIITDLLGLMLTYQITSCPVLL